MTKEDPFVLFFVEAKGKSCTALITAAFKAGRTFSRVPCLHLPALLEWVTIAAEFLIVQQVLLAPEHMFARAAKPSQSNVRPLRVGTARKTPLTRKEWSVLRGITALALRLCLVLAAVRGTAVFCARQARRVTIGRYKSLSSSTKIRRYSPCHARCTVFLCRRLHNVPSCSRQ